MVKSISFFIGLRYSLSKRDQRYVSFVSMFSIGSMAIGVSALIIVLSVMNGFDKEIKGRLLQVIPHIVVMFDDMLAPETYLELRDSLIKEGNVETVEPLVRSFAMLSANGQKLGAELRNINSTTAESLGLSKNPTDGVLSNLDHGNFGVLIGSPMARKLGIGIGDRIKLVLPSFTVSPVGIFPRVKMVHVAGIFQVGAQVDATTIMMQQQDIQKILRLGNNFHGLQISLADPLLAETNRKEFEAVLSVEAQWTAWQQSMESLFQAMEMEKRVVSLLLSVIIGVAAFNIVASLALGVSERQSDIAVLRTLGVSPMTVMKIFVVQGMVAGCSGIVLGAFLGCFVALYIGDILEGIEQVSGTHLFDPAIYLITTLPSDIAALDVIKVCSAALFISLIATLYPSWRASKILPAEALSYEV